MSQITGIWAPSVEPSSRIEDDTAPVVANLDGKGAPVRGIRGGRMCLAVTDCWSFRQVID